MKRIVFIGGGLLGGGAEHQCAQLMDMLIENGYRVTYASFGDEPDHYSVSPQIKRVSIGKGKSLFVKMLLTELYLLFLRADVLVAFSQRLSVISLFPLLLRPDIKVISSERNYTINKADRFERILTKTRLYKRADIIVPNNYSQGRYLSEKYPFLKSKIHVITNYTELNLYKATPVPNNECLRIGIFCRFEYQKNFHRFIEAVKLCVDHNPSLSFHIDWFGNHQFSNNRQIEYYNKGVDLIHTYGLDSYITINDPVKNVAELIPTYDVMCLPSLHEGFSNSISEYICCGRPVICSDVSDNNLMVHEGENGYLFNPLNVEDIHRALDLYLSTTPSQRSAMGKKSREIAEALFCKKDFIDEYINIIES